MPYPRKFFDADGRPDFHGMVKDFCRKIKRVPSGCWEFTGWRNKLGYGHVGVAYKPAFKSSQAHRVSYEMLVGKIPPGSIIRHTCDNPPCVNPAHLLTGTAADNAADMVSRNRQIRWFKSGGRKATAKISMRKVNSIRREFIDKPFSIASKSKEIGLNPRTMWAILHGKIWQAHARDGSILTRGASHSLLIQCAAAAKKHNGKFMIKPMTQEKADALRGDRIAGMTFAELAKKYGIGKSMVDRICRNKAWVGTMGFVTNNRAATSSKNGQKHLADSVAVLVDAAIANGESMKHACKSHGTTPWFYRKALLVREKGIQATLNGYVRNGFNIKRRNNRE